MLRELFKPGSITPARDVARERQRRCARRSRLSLEPLEDRYLLSANEWLGNSVELNFQNAAGARQVAALSAEVTDPADITLARFTLAEGDIVTAHVDTQVYGHGLDSFLRVFREGGDGGLTEIAWNDNFRGLDAGLTFQSLGDGVYVIGISSSGNALYDPNQPSGQTGTTFGLFDLQLAKTNATETAQVVAASFDIESDAIVWGDTVTVHYTLQNRGATTWSPGEVSLIASANHRFSDGLPALQTMLLTESIEPGESFEGTVTVELGALDTPLEGLEGLNQIFLGLQVDAALPASPAQGNDWDAARVLNHVAADGGAFISTFEAPISMDVNSRTDIAILQEGEETYFQIVLSEAGRLTAQVDATDGPVSLVLCDAEGRPIVQSDGQANQPSNPHLSHTLNLDAGGGVYYLKVVNRQSGENHFRLSTTLVPSISRLNVVPQDFRDTVVVEADFNGDGVLDLAKSARGATILLGNGDGSFRDNGRYGPMVRSNALAVGDFNGDGRIDLVVASTLNNGVAVLLGNGDGSFQSPLTVSGTGGDSLQVGDFNGDGNLDVAIGRHNGVRVVLGNGTGNFTASMAVTFVGSPTALGAGDFDGDNWLDLVVTDVNADTVTILHNSAGAAFAASSSQAVGQTPRALAVADLNHDGFLDVAVVNTGSDDVSVLYGNGLGDLEAASTYQVGALPRAITTGDFNGDNRVDLAVANGNSSSVTVILGQSNGAMAVADDFLVGSSPVSLVAGDFDGDGAVDLITDNYTSSNLTVLLGHGDGSFVEGETSNVAGEQPWVMVEGDFNGDGERDLAVGNQISSDVSILLGSGDGTFQNVGEIPVGDLIESLATGDFNGDGRLDLAVGDYYSNAIFILLGNGDGSFIVGESLEAPGPVTSLAVADFDDDGQLDLAAAFRFADSAMVYLRTPDGGFVSDGPMAVGVTPLLLHVGDFDGDGDIDFATANYYSQDLTLLLGDGEGHFDSPVSSPLGFYPLTQGSSAVGYFDGDQLLDFVAVYYNTVYLLVGRDGGSFEFAGSATVDAGVQSVTVGDFDGDGNLDVAASLYTAAITILLGDGQGGLTPLASAPALDTSRAMVAVDFNQDGRTDLAVANTLYGTITINIGAGDGTFLAPGLTPNAIRSTPIVASLTHAHSLDVVVLSETGKILVRQGVLDQPGVFQSARVLNPAEENAVRDIALVSTSEGTFFLAGLNASAASPGVTLYRPQANGAFLAQAGPPLPEGFLPTAIASADLDGDQRGDLVIAGAASNQVYIALQNADGSFADPVSWDVGVNPAAIAFADASGDGVIDVLVANAYSGQISLLVNLGGGAFETERRYRAGLGAYELTALGANWGVHSLERTSALVAGNFNDDGLSDLFVANLGSGSITLLRGAEGGGLLNPDSGPTLYGAGSPSAVVSGHFAGNDSILDLAVLSRTGPETGVITVYQGDEHGGMTKVAEFDAGNRPTGITVTDIASPNGGGPDGKDDLIVGNALGDLLILPGLGSGQFGAYRRADRNVGLALAETSQAGRRTFYFSDRGNDRLGFGAFDVGADVVNASSYQSRDAGILAPGPQKVVSVEGVQYLVVINNGSNQVFVYQLDELGNPIGAAKQTYFTGTDPVDLAVTGASNDLNGDAIPDLVVVNQGSNDVSIYLGQLNGGQWTLAYRPRQSSGGLGPTSVAISDVSNADGLLTGDGKADLVVSNGQSNSLVLLPSRGQGYFVTDASQDILAFAGSNPGSILVGNFDAVAGADIVALNNNGSELLLIANFQSSLTTTVIASGASNSLHVAAGNFNADGVSDLLVSNADRGAIDLYFGGSSGFQLAATIAHPLVPQLSDFAFISAGSELDLYGVAAGQDTAVLLGSFLPSQPPPSFLPAGPGLPNGLEFISASNTSTGDFVNNPFLQFAIFQQLRLRLTKQDEIDEKDDGQELPPELIIENDSGFAGQEDSKSEGTTASGRWGAGGSILLLNLEESVAPKEVPTDPMPEPPMSDEDEVHRDEVHLLDLVWKDYSPTLDLKPCAPRALPSCAGFEPIRILAPDDFNDDSHTPFRGLQTAPSVLFTLLLSSWIWASCMFTSPVQTPKPIRARMNCVS